MQDELDDFMCFCRIERWLAPLTCSAYGRDVRTCLAFLHERGIDDLAAVKPADLRAFLAAEATHHPAVSSQSRTLAALKGFFRFLVENEALVRDPAAVLRTPKKREALPDVQTCIVHLIRHSLRFVPEKHRKQVARELRPIYTAVNADAALEALESFERSWAGRYPMIGQSWREAWEQVIPFLAFPPDARRIVYTTDENVKVERRSEPRFPGVHSVGRDGRRVAEGLLGLQIRHGRSIPHGFGVGRASPAVGAGCRSRSSRPRASSPFAKLGRAVDPFREETVVVYLEDYRRTRSPAPATYYRRFTLLRRFFRWLSGREGVRDPFLDLDGPMKPRQEAAWLSARRMSRSSWNFATAVPV
jgi:site-specific recombinase XerD